MGISSDNSPSKNGQSIGYIPSIDGFRTIAVLSVLIFHLRSNFLPGGYVGVDIFFVISGFVVTASLMDRSFPSLRALILYFYARRLVRIMPALIVMLLVTMLISNFFVPSSWLSGFSDDVGKAAYIGVSNIVLALRSDNYFAPADGLDPYLHTWSLGVEEQFYLIFPFLIFWHQRRRRNQAFDRVTLGAIAILSLLSLALSAALSGDLHRYAFFFMPPRFWELGLGMMLCLSVTRWRPWVEAWPACVGGAATLLAFGLIAIAFTIGQSDYFPFPLALLPTLASALAICLLVSRMDSRASHILATPLMVGLGKRSYSIYLWHWPIFVLMRWTSGLHTPILMAIAGVLAIVMGSLSYHFVEQPTRRHPLARTLPRGRLVAASLIAVLACTGVGYAMVRYKGKMSLSTTSHYALWYADQYKKLSPALSKCAVARADQYGDAGHIALFTPDHCSIARRPETLIAIGDSHAIVYDPLLRQYAASTGKRVWLMYNGGCSFLPLMLPMAKISRCASATAKSQDALDKALHKGDILFLPSLRLERIEDREDEQAARTGASQPVRREAAVAEAIAFLRGLEARGVHIVFEAPTPIFRTSPFRCADWFNRSNPICAPGLTMPRQDIFERRAPVIKAMTEIAALNKNVSIWDPLPILCPQEICRAMWGDKPLFFDGDHLSGFGTDLLTRSFFDHMTHLDRVTAGPGAVKAKSLQPNARLM